VAGHGGGMGPGSAPALTAGGAGHGGGTGASRTPTLTA